MSIEPAVPVGTPSRTDEGLRYQESVESNARTYPRSIRAVLNTGYLATVTDIEGRQFIDCLAGAGTLALGHNHPDVIVALKAFLESNHILHGLDIATPTKLAFLRALLDCFPPAFRERAKVQLCGPTGADAVEAALKLFKTHTGRSTILSFHGAYHGMSSGGLALTGNLAAKSLVAGLMPDVHFLPFPYSYRCPFGVGGARGEEIGLTYIERMLKDPESGIRRPAAVIVEIVQGEGGSIPASDQWMQGLRRITAELEIPLVIDEIQTGFGRTGHMFAYESSGIVPDAVLVSKAVGGGLPLSAVVYDRKYDTWAPGAHAGTFRGNQMAMAAGMATLEVIRREGLVESAAAKGRHLLARFRRVQQGCPFIGDVRGRGLMIGVEIVDPSLAPDALGAHPSAPALARKIKQGCFKRGVIVESGGRHSAVLRFLPPLVITHEELDRVADVLEESILEGCGDV